MRRDRGAEEEHFHAQYTLTNAEDVEAESVIDRLVDQLVWHAVKADMARKRYSASPFSLNKQK